MRNGVPQASGSSNAATSSRPVTGSLQLTPCWTQPRRGSNPLWTGASGTISIQRGRKPVWSSPTPVSRELTGRVRFEESLTEAQRLVSDARTASINGEEDRAQQQYREAKSKLEAVLSASDEKPSSSVVEAKQLHAKLEEALASGADSSEREKKSSTETETAATEQSSKSDSQRPTRDDLINELQTLTEGPRWRSKGT